MKKLFILTLTAASIFLLPGCVKEKTQLSYDQLESMDFGSIEESAKGTDVRFYMWGGSMLVNEWVDNVAAPRLKEEYDINLERVPMDASVFVNKLLSEKKSGRETGVIDLLWINGENFKNAKQADLLFGPFTRMLPNFNSFIDAAAASNDAGLPVDGYEAPYGRAQFVFEYDSLQVPVPPENFSELLSWAEDNPGLFTYPQPPDFTGSAFIRQAFYELSGGYEQFTNGFDKELFYEKSQLLWNYLNKLEPFLWRKGETYPSDLAALDTLFERGEAAFNMSFTQTGASGKIAQGRYPESVKTVVFKHSSLANTHFTAIPFNAPNKAGALVTINMLLSPELQLSKNNPENWGDFTVLDFNRMPENYKEQFNSLDLGPATLPMETLNANAAPEISSEYIEALERGWKENVLQK